MKLPAASLFAIIYWSSVIHDKDFYGNRHSGILTALTRNGALMCASALCESAKRRLIIKDGDQSRLFLVYPDFDPAAALAM